MNDVLTFFKKQHVGCVFFYRSPVVTLQNKCDRINTIKLYADFQEDLSGKIQTKIFKK
jgi:hypothetical protein